MKKITYITYQNFVPCLVKVKRQFLFFLTFMFVGAFASSAQCWDPYPPYNINPNMKATNAGNCKFLVHITNTITSGNPYSTVNDVVNYTYTLYQIGSCNYPPCKLGPHPASVHDPLVTNITLISGDNNGDGILKEGELWFFTGSYTITQADIDRGFVDSEAYAINLNNGMRSSITAETARANYEDDTDGDGVADSTDAFPNDPTETTDSDEDGVGDNADCDNNNNAIHTAITYYVDTDGDGYGATPENICSTTVPQGYASIGGDCDDNNHTVYPGALDRCDGKDNDCDGIVDEVNEHIWTGNIDTNWETLGNWQDDSAPGLFFTADVTIPSAGITNYPVITEDQERLKLYDCANLTILSGASLTINPNVVLHNYGKVHIKAGGTLTFKSDETGSAFIGRGGDVDMYRKSSNTKMIDKGGFDGEVTIERYIPARRAFRLLSSPVTTTNFISNNWQQGTHITGSTSGANGFDKTQTGNPSMFTFDNVNQAWSNMPNTNDTNLINGTPYQLMVRGDRNTDLTNNNAPPSPTTLIATGNLDAENTAPEALVLSGSNGDFNFIGNPFQAPVDMRDVLDTYDYLKKGSVKNSTNVNPYFYWVWDPTLNTRGAFTAVILETGFAENGDSKQNHLLQAGQACWVQTGDENTSASILFTQFSKYTEETETKVFKMGNTKGEKLANTGHMRLSLYETAALANNESARDGILIIFDDDGNNAVDAKDAAKFTNLDENFASSNNGTLLGVETRLTPVDTDEIPLKINTYRSINYTIVAEGIALQGAIPFLLDTYTGQSTEIPQNGSINYAYIIDSNSPASIAGDRFKVVYASASLSVENMDMDQIQLYPNPTNTGQFFLNIPNNLVDLEITIYNTIGTTLFHKKGFTAGSKASINTSFTKNHGIYFVKLSAQGKTTTKKLIIN